MTIGLLGKKCGMTRIFTPEGVAIPVTVIEVQPNKITQVKTILNDGYNAIQVASGSRKASRVTKAMAGHYAKAGVEPGEQLAEFRVDSESVLSQYVVGGELKVDIF